jgi:hypothetical protein
MLRALRHPTRHSPVLLLTAAALWTGSPPARAQVVIYNSNGFEAPGYTAGTITGQTASTVAGPLTFQALPTPSAGMIQSGTTFAGGQAFQIVGSQLVSTSALGYGDGNFWYVGFSAANAFNPVASGNPIVHMQFQGRVSGALALPSDIPFAGPYLEGYTLSGTQQAISPILFNTNGGITVYSNSAVAGSDLSISSADGLASREAWHSVDVQMNFNAQSFRVVLDGTPVTFSEGAFSGIDVPFRNTNGPTVSIAELGMQGYYNASFNPTLNNVYFDNFAVTAQPVPEPSTLALVGFAVAGATVRYRRRRPA